MKDFETIMLFGAVFTEQLKISVKTKCHEAAHVEQYQTLFTAGLALAVSIIFICFAFDCYGWWMLSLFAIPVFLYYIWYLFEYVVRIFVYKKGNTWKDAHDKAYRMIAFEQDAKALEDEYRKPCPERKTASCFSFLKYY